MACPLARMTLCVRTFDPAEMVVRGRWRSVLALETRDVTIFALARLADHAIPKLVHTWNEFACIAGFWPNICQNSPNMHLKSMPNTFRLLYATSPLHDIGKVGIPDSVLLSPVC